VSLCPFVCSPSRTKQQKRLVKDCLLSNMDAYTKNGIALVIFHCIGTFVILLLTIDFLQKQKDKVINNKFVAINLLMAVSIILAEIMVIPRLALYEFVLAGDGGDQISKLAADSLLYFNGLFILICSGTHVLLLFLRTKVIIENAGDSKLQSIYNTMVWSTAVLGLLMEIVRARLFYQGNSKFTSILEALFAILSAFYGVCVTSVDVISTYWFVRYVKQSSAVLGNQSSVRNEFRTIIAKMGTNICMCSVLLMICFAASRIPTQRVPQDWIMMAVVVEGIVISAMWMHMKKSLDKPSTVKSSSIPKHSTSQDAVSV
jgi:hypothetical protein